MRRAAIHDPYLDTAGGGERYILSVAHALVANGWKVELAWHDPKILKWLEERLGIDLSGIEIVPDIAKGAGYDLCFWLSDGSVPLLFAKQNVIHFQTPFTNVHGKSLLNRGKFLKIHKIICNSNFTKKVIDQEFGVKSSVLYPPVATEEFKPTNKENMIISVGRFSQLQQSKRQDILVEAFKKMCKSGLKGWKLVLLGGSDVGGDGFVKKLKLESEGLPIHILENLPFSEVKKYYGRAKIFWSASGYGIDEVKEPSKVEHFGITVVEGMAAGAVTIATNKGGHKEIIHNRKNGYLWDTTDELMEITKSVIKDEKTQKSVTQNGIKDASRFAESVFEENFLNLIK